MKRSIVVSVLTGALSLTPGTLLAADQATTPQPVQAQEQIFGSQLMTRQERSEFRARMRAAKTAEEREQLRKEHHEQMSDRAKSRGLTLPDEPPARGSRMGPGGGMGPGMGSGGGRMGGGGR